MAANRLLNSKIASNQPVLSPLPERLEGGDGDGAGEVQAANRVLNRYPQASIGCGGCERGGETRRFTTKHQGVPWLVTDLRVKGCGFLGEVPVVFLWKYLAEFPPVIDGSPVQVFPVIEPRAAELFLIDAESEWADQPEVSSRGEAAPSDVPRVLGNLGLVQDDIEQGCVIHNW